MGFGAARLREDLGRQFAGFAQVIDDQAISCQRPLQSKGVAGRAGIFRQADDGESLGEEITPFAQGAAVGGDGEEHPSVAVEAVAHDEVIYVPGGRKPFRARLDLVVELGEHPQGPALQPHGLVGVEDAAVAIEGIELAAMLAVKRVIQPEGDDLVE